MIEKLQANSLWCMLALLLGSVTLGTRYNIQDNFFLSSLYLVDSTFQG